MAKVAFLKVAGAGEGPLSVVRTALTRQVIVYRCFIWVRVYRRDR
jgi:hypothetical protein